jgi:hypothetical protein
LNNNCNNEDLDGWSIMHIMIYFTLGLFLPNAHLEVLGISIVSELWEYVIGWRARWILDPITNMFGYHMGTLVAKYYNISAPTFIHDSMLELTVLVFVLYKLLDLNTPEKILL